MKIKLYKIIIFIISLAALMSTFGRICYATQELLLNYPQITGATSPNKLVDNPNALPELIKYIYMFALAAVGVVALLAMLIGAVKYVLSAGNPSKASDAKDQIFSAIIGIILLLASVMILRIINPDLVTIGFTLPTISGTGGSGGGGGSNHYCQCTLNQRFYVIAPDQSNPTSSCQQYIADNCPSNATSCALSNTYQNTYTHEWMCDWQTTWSARFGPLACTNCNINTHPCSSYFNNTIHVPCSSAGATCSANCL